MIQFPPPGSIAYSLGALILFATGILLESHGSLGAGLFILYSGSAGSWITYKISFKSLELLSPEIKKRNLFRDLFILAAVSVFLFSTVKSLLLMFLSDYSIPDSGSGIVLPAVSVIYFEIVFRITGNSVNRKAVAVLLPLLVLSGASGILGGFWGKTDLIMGFLLLALTAIISFKRACVELADILR